MTLFLISFFVLTFIGPCWLLFNKEVDFKADWRTANRYSARLAPRPEASPDAVIQAYSARAFHWRGLIASHTWISVKPQNTEQYTVYQVVGWRAYHGEPPLMISEDIPDRYWYNAKPKLILDVRGEKAQRLIPLIDEAARAYPHPNEYVLWPGPNSNTFPAYIARKVPALGLAMPSDAIGKDLLPGKAYFARSPSGTGLQLSIHGIFGVTLGLKEGIELNLLGMTYGIRFYPPAILLPGKDFGW